MALTLIAISVGLAEATLALVLMLLVLTVTLIWLALSGSLLEEVLESSGEGGALHDLETANRNWVDWLSKLLPWQVFILARKEIVNSLRERDVISAIFTSVGMGVILVVIYKMPSLKMGNFEDTLTLPIFLAMGLFLGALLHCAMLGSAAVGMEGKRLWLLKSLPVKAKLVLQAKAVALIFLSIPSMLIIVFPMSLAAGFPLPIIIFFIFVAAILTLALTGMGLYVGALFANFDDANRGQPDFMVQFMVMVFAAILSLLLLAVPAAVMMADRQSGGYGFIGLAASGLMVLVAYAAYKGLLRGAAGSYRSIDIEAYD